LDGGLKPQCGVYSPHAGRDAHSGAGEYEGFEADDVIGALARRAERGVDVVIVSSDKDMLQLVDDHVQMYNPVKEDIWYDAAATEARSWA
jgi:5'-3' exonuclease